MNSSIISHPDVLKFCLSGRSVFTLKNPKTGNRFTFKIKKHRLNQIWFVSVLTNNDSYSFIGSIKDMEFKHSKKSDISKDAQSFKVFDYFMKNIVSGTLPDFLEVWHEGRCGRCGKSLTDPESIKVGLGPFCRKDKK